jgi:hypothetical protein
MYLCIQHEEKLSCITVLRIRIQDPVLFYHLNP